jgi:cell division septal protein FtsQ
MSRSRPVPKRRRPSTVRRLQPFWFLLLLALGALAVGVGFLASWNELYPRAVDVVGNRVVGSNEIVQSAGIDHSKNMWLQSTAAMSARIEGIPYIETADVHRRAPDTIVIAVTERTPYAFLDSPGFRVTVDHDLRVLQRGEPVEVPKGLPIFEVASARALTPGTFVSDPSVLTMRSVADTMHAARLDPATLQLDRFGDATAILRSGIRVLLGDEQSMGQKIALIQPILAQVGRGKRPVVAIDLRALTTPVVVYGR